MGRMVLAYALMVLALASLPSARTWYITPDGTGDAPTIQAGVDSASSGDEVVLADGTFTGDGNRDVDWPGKILTVRSESGDPQTCIIDCEATDVERHRGLSGSGPLIEGITIMNGYQTRGGAVRNHGRRTISNCRFLNNHAGLGGAIYSNQGDGVFRISDCVFSENSADDGGGAIAAFWYTYAYGTIEIDNCTFMENHASYGCILHEYWQSYLRTSSGGGSQPEPDIWIEYSNCTIVGNSGGVLFWADGDKASADLTSNSSAPLQWYYYTISQSIVAYNDLTIVFPGSPPLLACVNIYGNSCGDWVGNGSDQYGLRGNFSACPAFCSFEAGDLHLCDGSHCAPGNHPDTTGCGLIGAWDVGCVCGPSRTEPTTWGAIKSIYR